MRRVLTILFAVLTIASLLLSCAIAALWVRSYRTMDLIAIGERRRYRAVSGGGGIFLESLAASQRVGQWRVGRARPMPPIAPQMAQQRVPSGLVQYRESPVDYARSNYAEIEKPLEHYPGRSLWVTRRYAGRTLFHQIAWVSTPRPALPASVPVGLVVQTTFNNGDGSGSEEVLSGRGIWIPYWLVPVPMLILTALLVPRFYFRRRRARRLAANLCVACGFDLRASDERCPECGATIGARP